MEDCGGGKEMDDWLEEQIQARFPDDLNIPPGQLRVRISKLVWEYEQRMLGRYKGPDSEDDTHHIKVTYKNIGRLPPREIPFEDLDEDIDE